MFSNDLEATISQCYKQACEQRHEFVTVEHLLFSLLENPQARIALLAFGADLPRLARDLGKIIAETVPVLPHGDERDTQPTLAFQRVLQRAVYQVQSSGRKEVTGAHVLVAIFSEKDSHAARFLYQQKITRLDVVNFISHGNNTIETPRVPPHSTEAERAVLGGLMLSIEALDRVADKLGEQDFYRKDHQLIWRAIDQLANKGMPCDAVTLGHWLDAQGLAEMVGGVSYLVELASTTSYAANLVAHAEIVHEKSLLRQLIDVCTSVIQVGYRPEGRSVQEILASSAQSVLDIAASDTRRREDMVPIRGAVKEAFRLLSERYQNRGQLAGVATGFTDLDKLTSGLKRSELIIVAGCQAMGKTALSMNLAVAVALHAKKPAAIFSMGISAPQLALRLMSSVGRIQQQHLHDGDLTEEDWSRVSNAIARLSEARIFIDDTPGLSPIELRSRVRRLHREQGGLGLIVIDDLQLMQVSGNHENYVMDIAKITQSLKSLAKELDVPVVALSRLNRSLEQREDKRPMMSDLRELGAIEQDADLILFVYRDEYYHHDSPDKGMAEVIIGKQCNGKVGTVKLAFLDQYARFENAGMDGSKAAL